VSHYYYQVLLKESLLQGNQDQARAAPASASRAARGPPCCPPLGHKHLQGKSDLILPTPCPQLQFLVGHEAAANRKRKKHRGWRSAHGLDEEHHALAGFGLTGFFRDHRRLFPER